MSWKFVEHCRRRFKRAYKRNMALVQILEREYYGENSFYHLQDLGQYTEPTYEEDEEGEDLGRE